MTKPKTLKYFQSRIGKRIFRDHHECFSDCSLVSKNGLIVNDENHAQYLFDLQNDFGCEGYDLNYRDAL